jgi:predicted lactoylglutathione lyase
VLAGMKAPVPGTVKFIAQPAEERLGSARARRDARALANPAPQPVFGLHVRPTRVGQIAVHQDPLMAAAGNFTNIVIGRQTRGSQRWSAVDPIVVASQIVLGLPTTASRQVDVAYLPSVLTVGQFVGATAATSCPTGGGYSSGDAWPAAMWPLRRRPPRRKVHDAATRQHMRWLRGSTVTRHATRPHAHETAMPRTLFITLPVTDLPRARAFYTALGFAIDEAFSSPGTACVVVSDAIRFMLATHDQFRAISPKPLILPSEGATCLFALSCESRAEVDALTDAAIAAGGRALHDPEDLGFMYSRAFEDPDGNGFGPVWMDPAAPERRAHRTPAPDPPDGRDTPASPPPTLRGRPRYRFTTGNRRHSPVEPTLGSAVGLSVPTTWPCRSIQ